MSLESWLVARLSVKAMGLVLEHSKMTTLAVELLSKCVDDAVAGKRDDLTVFREPKSARRFAGRAAPGLQGRLIESGLPTRGHTA